MTTFIGVSGTGGAKRKDEWSHADSLLSTHLKTFGLENIAGQNGVTLPFEWSTDLDIMDPSDWAAGGRALYYYIVPTLYPNLRIPPSETVIISHSHGRQVVLYAANYGLKIDRWIDISGPVREHVMADVARMARPNIRKWIHVHSDFTDRMQWLGELCDGHLGIVRKCPFADYNDNVPRAGHSGVLRDPKWFPEWEKRNWIRFLQTGILPNEVEGPAHV